MAGWNAKYDGDFRVKFQTGCFFRHSFVVVAQCSNIDQEFAPGTCKLN